MAGLTLLPDRRLLVIQGHLCSGALLCLLGLFFAVSATLATIDPDTRTPILLGGGLSLGLVVLGFGLMRRRDEYEFGSEGLRIRQRRSFGSRVLEYPDCRVLRTVLEAKVSGGMFNLVLGYQGKTLRFHVALEVAGVPGHERFELGGFRSELRAFDQAEALATHLHVPLRDGVAGPVPASPSGGSDPQPQRIALRGWRDAESCRMEALGLAAAGLFLWLLHAGLCEVHAFGWARGLLSFGIPILVLGSALVLALRFGRVVVEFEPPLLRIRYQFLGLCLRDLYLDPSTIRALRYHDEHEVLRGVSLVLEDRVLRIGRRASVADQLAVLHWLEAGVRGEAAGDPAPSRVEAAPVLQP